MRCFGPIAVGAPGAAATASNWPFVVAVGRCKPQAPASVTTAGDRCRDSCASRESDGNDRKWQSFDNDPNDNDYIMPEKDPKCPAPPKNAAITRPPPRREFRVPRSRVCQHMLPSQGTPPEPVSTVSMPARLSPWGGLGRGKDRGWLWRRQLRRRRVEPRLVVAAAAAAPMKP